MPSGSLNQQAALSLIQRARESVRQSEANLLIDAAARIEPSVNADKLKAEWLERWLVSSESRVQS